MRLIFIAMTFVLPLWCASCQNASRPELSPQPATATQPATSAPVQAPVPSRRADEIAAPVFNARRMLLLEAQQDYWTKEGPSRRGALFEQVSLRLNQLQMSEPPVSEIEVFELLGLPDRGETTQGGAFYVYFYDRFKKKDWAVFVSVDADGIVRQIAYNDSSVNDLSKLNQYKSWSDITPRGRSPRFVPQTGSAYLGIVLRQHPQLIGPPVLAVAEILPGSPASRSGLRIGDLIVKVDDQSIASTDPEAFIKRISAFPPGKVITLTIWRGNDWPPKPQQVQFTLGSHPPPQ